MPQQRRPVVLPAAKTRIHYVIPHIHASSHANSTSSNASPFSAHDLDKFSYRIQYA